MSSTIWRRCPIENCNRNIHPVLADKYFTKKHILYDHDYKEKLDAAIRLKIILDINERRSPQWLAENLSEFSIGENQFE